MAGFFGREAELKTLNQFLRKKTASLIVVRGRRRIGKSRLIEEFSTGHTLYSFSGIAPTKDTTAQMQRDEFAFQLGQFLEIPGIKAEDWNVLFLLLAKLTRAGRVVVVLDEISWMGSKDPQFLSKLKNIWDSHFKKNDDLILILCGSASAWIEKNILSSTAFVGRISQSLILEELPINVCSKFWRNVEKNISVYEKLKILSVTGGIPKYLEEIDPNLSAEENIKKLCFTKGGFLVDEFKHMFSDLFLPRRSEIYKKILEILAKGSKEIKEICADLKIQQTGRISEYLEELSLSGFINRDYTWDLVDGQDSKLSHYRLSDNYFRFYLKYIDKYKTKIQRNSFSFKSLTTLPEWFTILGFQFENLVLNNRKFIHQALGLKGEDIVSENPFFQHKTSAQPGCQIDYMIQTRFNCLYICEIKFSKNLIGASVIKEVQQKIDRIKRPKGFSCRAVLIHVNGVQEEIFESAFFSEIIDFGELLMPSTVA